MNREEYRISFGLRLRRSIVKVLARFIFHVLGHVQVTGTENIPRNTAYVAAVNHISIYDPPFLLAFWPETLEAIGAIDVFDRPFQGKLLRIYDTIPVQRNGYDRRLIDTILNLLHNGHRLMIAPEGGRSHALAMRRAKPGVGYILAEAGVPVVPVGIMGTTDDFLKRALRFQRPSLELRIGKPFMLPEIQGSGEARRAIRQRNADLVMQHIAGLLPPEYHGVYADTAFQSA